MASLWQHQVDNEAKSANYSIFSLSSIKTANEHIKFITNTSGYLNRVNYIDIVDSLTNTLKKRVEFYYHTIYFDIHTYTLLDSLKIYGKNLQEAETYRFNYYDEDDYSYGFFSNGNLVPDHWGYNKITQGIYKLLHNEFGNDFVKPNGAESSTNRISGKLSESYASYLDNRNENYTPELLSLKGIRYPTGGSVIYEYEPNKSSDAVPRYLGGIRIKNITHSGATYDVNGNPIPAQRRDYTYQSGYTRAALNYTEFRKEFPVFLNHQERMDMRGLIYSSNYLGDRIENDNTVHYAIVTENLFSNSGTNGKNVYQYNNIASSLEYHPYNIQFNDPAGYMQYYLGGPSYASMYSLWKKPVLLSKRTYTNNNKLVKKESFVYGIFNNQSYTGLKVKPYARIIGQFDEYFPIYYAKISSIFNHGLYAIETGNTLPIERSETIYSETDSITTVVTYEYNSLNQVTKEILTDSKNEILEKNTVYPANIPYDHIAAQMIAANDINNILEQSAKKNNMLTQKIENQYYLQNSLFLLSKSRTLNIQSQLMEDAIIFKKYDAKGNIQSISRANDLTLNYLWSYRNQLPIAEVKGIDFATLESLLGAAAIVNFGLNPNPGQSDIMNFLLPVRTAIQNGTLPQAEIISYSYDPLVGIKTQTDTRGVTLFYDYDSFDRLSSIKDEYGAILKKIEYQYNTQN